MGSPKAGSPLSEEDSWPSPGASTGSPAKLFIFNLARTVTDADLRPLFKPFQPLYATVAVGKKGTSRRFGFAKFASPSAAQAALDSLRGTHLHGMELDLNFAVALAEPDPASGVQAKLRAKLRAEAQETSPRITAHPPSLPPGFSADAAKLNLPSVAAAAAAAAAPDKPHASVVRVLPLPLSIAPAAAATSRASPSPLPSAAAPISRPPAAAPVATAPAGEQGDPALPMQHLLIVRHGAGLSHDRVMQRVWCFRPINVSTTPDASGGMKSTVLFSTLQQAQAAADVFAQQGSDGGAATSLVSLPLHAPPEHFFPAPAPPQQPDPQLPKQQAPVVQQAQPAARPPLPPGMRSVPQAQPQQPQQQREGVGATMRPLYAAPRPSHMRPLLVPAPYPYGWPPSHGPAPPQLRPVPTAAARPAQAPPPYHHLAPAQQPPAQAPAQPPVQHAGPTTPPGQAPPLPSLPDSLGSEGSVPSSRPGLNPSAVSFSPTKPGRAAAAAAAARGQREPAAAAGTGGAPPVAMQPVLHSIFLNVEAALAGRSYVPAWDRMQQEATQPGQPLVLAETLQCDSGTEDEGDYEPDLREVYAAVSAGNLNTVFVTRTRMRRLAPVELLLKQTAVGGQEGAPSVLEGAVVRVLIDKAYKLRQVQSTYIKPESQRLMLVLHDVSSPIPAEHISNTNPLLSSPLPAPAEAELLELHSKLAFHGRRLFSHEARGRVAATAWRLQFADHWQAHEADGRAGDELRLAVTHLRAMLADEDEIRWRRRGVQGLDLAQEAAAVAAAFRLPHNAAANWMGSPRQLVVSTFPGGSPASAERSNITGDYQSRPALSQHEVLGLQRSSRLLPSRAAARSLLRAAADPAQHDELMAAFFAGQQVPAHEQPAYGAGAGAGAASAAPPASAPPASSGLSSAHSRGSSTGLSEQDEADADAESLLAEAATFGAVDADTDGLPAFFTNSLKLERGSSPTVAASAAPATKPAGGSENGGGNGISAAQPLPSCGPASKQGAGILPAALERRGSGLIAAVRAKQQ